jgi:hypothetical protein
MGWKPDHFQGTGELDLTAVQPHLAHPPRLLRVAVARAVRHELRLVARLQRRGAVHRAPQLAAQAEAAPALLRERSFRGGQRAARGGDDGGGLVGGGHELRVVALQVVFERRTLKSVFLIGYRLWV